MAPIAVIDNRLVSKTVLSDWHCYS